MVWYGMVWYGMVWCMVWYGMVWYGMVWYGMYDTHTHTTSIISISFDFTDFPWISDISPISPLRRLRMWSRSELSAFRRQATKSWTDRCSAAKSPERTTHFLGGTGWEAEPVGDGFTKAKCCFIGENIGNSGNKIRIQWTNWAISSWRTFQKVKLSNLSMGMEHHQTCIFSCVFTKNGGCNQHQWNMFIGASWPCLGFWPYPVGYNFETGRRVVEPTNEVGFNHDITKQHRNKVPKGCGFRWFHQIMGNQGICNATKCEGNSI